MSIIRITDPVSFAVSLAEVKEFVKLPGSTAEDDLFVSFLKSAESYAENYMKRSIMPQQWRLRIDSVSDNIQLLRGPLSTVSTAVSNFSYYDSTNGTNAMPSTCYTVDTNYEYPRIYRTYDADWPDDIRPSAESVNIEYWTGYKNKDSVPEPIKAWIKLRVASQWQNREAIMIGSGNFLTQLPHNYVDGLLDEFVILQVA